MLLVQLGWGSGATCRHKAFCSSCHQFLDLGTTNRAVVFQHLGLGPWIYNQGGHKACPQKPYHACQGDFEPFGSSAVPFFRALRQQLVYYSFTSHLQMSARAGIHSRALGWQGNVQWYNLDCTMVHRFFKLVIEGVV